MKVAVVDYGSGNLASASRALLLAAERAGIAAEVAVTADPAVVAAADRVVLPGQGAFADCAAGLAGVAGLRDAVLGSAAAGRPFLGICVGMQLMAAPWLAPAVTEGFGWLRGAIGAMQVPAGLRLPQMGWNELVFTPGAHPLLEGLLPGDHAYFVHGYALQNGDAADVLANVLAHDSDAPVREMTAWALGNIEAKSGVTALSNALRHDADDRVRETAAWALARTEDRSSVEVLGVVAEGDRSARVRGTAAWAIGQLRGNGTKAPAGLVHLLKDDSEDVRLKAAWALGQVGDSSALPAIETALHTEQSSQVRRALIRALMRSGGRSEQTLTSLLSSSDAQVREAAVRGLAGSNSFNPWPWPWPRPRPMP